MSNSKLKKIIDDSDSDSDVEIVEKEKKKPIFSPTLWTFTVYLDKQEKYDHSIMVKYLCHMNKNEKTKMNENPIYVTVADASFSPGDVKITAKSKDGKREIVYGLYEVKRDGDFETNAGATVGSYESQLDDVLRLGNESIPYVGVILLYDSDTISDTVQKAAITISTKYQIRAKNKFTVHVAKSNLVHLATIIYRICQNIANSEIPLRAEHEMLESRNMRTERKKAATAEDSLELQLRSIPGFSKRAAFLLAKKYKNIPAFVDVLREKKADILDEITPKDLGTTRGLGKAAKNGLLVAYEIAPAEVRAEIHSKDEKSKEKRAEIAKQYKDKFQGGSVKKKGHFNRFGGADVLVEKRKI